MTESATVPAHERMRVGALLAFVGGFLDAYTYVLRGGVFANAQTGNMILMMLRLADGAWLQALYYLVPISAFFLGALLTEFLKLRYTDSQFIHWELIVIAAECVALAVVGFLPQAVPNAVVNVTVSFLCSMQFNSFRKLGSLPYATTFCTGNLRSAAENFFHFAAQHDRRAGWRCVQYMTVIVVFCIGAVVSAMLCSIWQERSIWVCCAALLVAELLMLAEKKEIHK